MLLKITEFSQYYFLAGFLLKNNALSPRDSRREIHRIDNTLAADLAEQATIQAA